MSNCSKCLFSGKFQDHGASIDVCTREPELTLAIQAYGREDCPYHFSKQDLIDVQEGNFKTKYYDSVTLIFDSFVDHIREHYEMLNTATACNIASKLTEIYFNILSEDKDV